MDIKIVKHVYAENSLRQSEHWLGWTIPKKVIVYAVVVDNRRVDGFLKYRNAQAKVRRLKKQEIK